MAFSLTQSVAPSALANIDEMSDRPPVLTTLANMRRQNKQDELEQYKADTERAKGDEYVQAGQAARAKQAATAAAAKGAPQITADPKNRSEYLTQYKGLMQYYYSSGDPELIKLAHEGMSKLKDVADQGSTANLQDAQSKEALANAKYTNAGKPGTTKPLTLKQQLDTDDAIRAQYQTIVFQKFPDVRFAPNEDGEEVPVNLHRGSYEKALEMYGKIAKEEGPDIAKKVITDGMMILKYDPPGWNTEDVDKDIMVPRGFAQRQADLYGSELTTQQIAALWLYELGELDEEEVSKEFE